MPSLQNLGPQKTNTKQTKGDNGVNTAWRGSSACCLNWATMLSRTLVLVAFDISFSLVRKKIETEKIRSKQHQRRFVFGRFALGRFALISYMESRFNIYSIIWGYLQIFEDIFKYLKISSNKLKISSNLQMNWRYLQMNNELNIFKWIKLRYLQFI